ncbi:taurine catabolism dioxygenase TauD [Fusarium austroafricanum]|uniref:Taurine catabolism dioxygenase TauD n=1 Tax=Fusarium austroafricanum TaxID=2364996 RepID=A0A8H4NVP8_9HYPO|nr:taurine catabolism dioxygenase TauD [Fusarium austroafricanum]
MFDQAKPTIANPMLGPRRQLGQATTGKGVQYYSSGVQAKFPKQLFTVPEALEKTTRYADIGYEYDEQKHFSRTQERLRLGGLRTDLPIGWPKVLEGPLMWKGSDFSDESLFVYHLSESENAEIRDALRDFKGETMLSSFPLPNLGKTLITIRDDVYHGRGFATLRGFNVDDLSPADATTAYLGLTSYIAERRGKQNQQGTMMINGVNTGKDVERDNAQIVMLLLSISSLLISANGPVGGSGIITSAWTVYNELAETRPDLVHVLAQPNWPFDTHGRDPPYYNRALLYWEDGKLITNYSRRILLGEPNNGIRTPGIPGLTEAQAEAIDALHAIGRKHELKQSMCKGDIRFINNLALMHRRDPYADTTNHHRHLLRLWLHNESLCWKLPMDLKLAWERIFNDRERQEEWHLVQYSSTGEQHVIPVWGTGQGQGQSPTPPPKPPPAPPVARCD